MTVEGEYAPSATAWVRKQVETIEATGDTRSVNIQGRPVVLLTMLGASSGKLRKVPLMRVEHDGVYVVVGSKGGAPEHPQWVANLLANPEIDLMDGVRSWPARARPIEGAEREQWWERAVAAFPTYAGYQRKTTRRLPLFLLEPR
jgi:deazaflavin-dependent oxidoreductase (nitroreductase family)